MRIATPVTGSLVRNDSFGTSARVRGRDLKRPYGGETTTPQRRASLGDPTSCRFVSFSPSIARRYGGDGHWRGSAGASSLAYRAGAAVRVGGRDKPLPYGADGALVRIGGLSRAPAPTEDERCAQIRGRPKVAPTGADDTGQCPALRERRSGSAGGDKPLPYGGDGTSARTGGRPQGIAPTGAKRPAVAPTIGRRNPCRTTSTRKEGE